MSKTMRFVIPSALLLAAAMSAGAAQARNADVQWSVTIGSPIYAAHGPVYVQPRPVYMAPAPVYYPHVPTHRAPRYNGPTRWDRDGDGVPNRYDRVYNPPWDRDGDGVPNRYDRVYNPVWDRDGDGIPNRHDPRYSPHRDRDGDGIPNRHDRDDRYPRDGWRR